jgi:hypothetical protein
VSVLERLADVLDELSRTELSSSEDIRAQMQLRARFDAITTRNLARWDANKTWADDGGRTGASWLAARCGIDKRNANRMLRLGRVCRDMPLTEQAWLAGDVHAEHVSVLSDVREIDGFTDDEALLVDHAMNMRFAGFVKAVAYWRQLHDPDDAAKKTQQQLDDRRFDLSKTFQGAWIGDLRSDPISGEILHITLRTIEHELWDQDWTEAKDRLGHDPLVHELRRTPKQRRHDALVEMAVRARTAPKDGRRPEPLFTVLVGYEGFQAICELASGTVLSPAALVEHLGDGWVERAVFDSPSRAIDIGEQRRIFTGATRRAVIIRELLTAEGTCFEDVCDEPEWRCRIDHTVEFSKGGRTNQTNGRLACGPHNRKRNGENKRKPNAE